MRFRFPIKETQCLDDPCSKGSDLRHCAMLRFGGDKLAMGKRQEICECGVEMLVVAALLLLTGRSFESQPFV